MPEPTDHLRAYVFALVEVALRGGSAEDLRNRVLDDLARVGRELGEGATEAVVRAATKKAVSVVADIVGGAADSVLRRVRGGGNPVPDPERARIAEMFRDFGKGRSK